jgi:hypothetical protein
MDLFLSGRRLIGVRSWKKLMMGRKVLLFLELCPYFPTPSVVLSWRGLEGVEIYGQSQEEESLLPTMGREAA